ncbi:MAG: NAD+ synthase [Sediminibacterium sp.]|nr:NAD+ synthase [Sediminibacterium sp.]
MIKICIAQINFIVGDIKNNVEKIIQATKIAQHNNADLILFSELSISGYIPKDLIERDDFMDEIETQINYILPHSKNIAIVVGTPWRNYTNGQKPCFNAALFIYQQEIKHIIHKSLLPTYDIFDEARYFEPGHNQQIIEFKNHKIAVTICEDIWNITEQKIYDSEPLQQFKFTPIDLILNLSASPFNYNKEQERLSIIKQNALTYQTPIVYNNCVGANTAIIFDGQSCMFDKNGNIVKMLPAFKEEINYIEIEKNCETNFQTTPENMVINTNFEFNPQQNIEHIYDALILGIKDYFNKLGFKKAILGSSGGIDSAVTACLASQALGSENLFTIALPSSFSSLASVDDAHQLHNNLQNSHEIIEINKIFEVFLNQLQPLFKNLAFGLAEENLQSRIRGNLIMTIANKFNYVLLNTSNKSELATGYGTLYGDMAGGLSVLGDLYKQQVYALAAYINTKFENLIPQNIISKAPSAELRLNQKDADSLPEYDILDFILYYFIDKNFSKNKIISLGYNAKIVEEIIVLVKKQEFKRQQFCPILRISGKSFGEGRRYPIVCKW